MSTKKQRIAILNECTAEELLTTAMQRGFLKETVASKQSIPTRECVRITKEATENLQRHMSDRDTGNLSTMAHAAEIFNAITDMDVKITPEDFALAMLAVKIARSRVSYNRDNYVDGAAYLSLAGEEAFEDAMIKGAGQQTNTVINGEKS